MDTINFKHNGSSLIEALLCVGMIGLASLAMVKLQSQLIQSNVIANQRSEALMLAESKMEELRSFSNEGLYNALSSGGDTYSGLNASYKRSWQITENTEPAYKTINLVVNWALRDGQTGSVVLDSKIAKYDPRLGGYAMKKVTTISP